MDDAGISRDARHMQESFTAAFRPLKTLLDLVERHLADKKGQLLSHAVVTV